MSAQMRSGPPFKEDRFAEPQSPTEGPTRKGRTMNRKTHPVTGRGRHTSQGSFTCPTLKTREMISSVKFKV
jgi:hypothetical protein